VGSIELVQAAMLIASSAAIVLATLHRRHAMVHLLLNRLGTPSKRRLLQSGCLLGSVFFIFLTIASLLALHDMWGAHEQSDLLHVPYVPLRILSAIAAAAAALALLAQGMRRPP
jgi:TRAP-type C4-dicarboxylate transport system permease small subunit